MKNINVGIIGAYPYNGNRGVGALSFSTLYLLEEIRESKKLNINYFLINNNYTKESDIINIGKQSIKITNISMLNFYKPKDLIKCILIKKHRRSFKAYRNMDIFMNMGEGDSFSDIYGKVRFNSINHQNKMARLLRKKYILLPQTIGPYKDPKIKNEAIKSIEAACLAFPRDKRSSAFVKENSNQKNSIEAVDVAFFMPFNNQYKKSDTIKVGLNISGLLWNGGYTKNNQFNLSANYKELTTSIIKHFNNIENVELHIVPHVVVPYRAIENDYSVSLDIINEYKSDRIKLAPFFMDPIQAKEYISSFDFFLGARMHATIAAFSSNVPVFPLAYSRKFNGLFEDTLNYSSMGDMVNDSNEIIISKMKKAYSDRDNLRKIIDERLNSVVIQRKETILEYIARYL
ncbi:polysaccharide pyruvyl transferase family protein [Saccharicrinis aurantiacus]|uniref:polysaccharide pyruvyl transferase family protein n=1 Tax=Saccharicrinis aurantiacus TaxID=1849719 RepID=UPI00248F8DB5|nr:polysaccharide pyruvyl transferase family protein [Saccharicrinis aurantiacus]